MRLNLRLKLGRLTAYFMISLTQTLEGVTSKVVGEKDLHLIFWDLEKCSREEAEKTLKERQFQHQLGNIFLVSDIKGSYRGWCFSRRSWKEYLIILLETDHLDYNFFYWTVRRGSATLRTQTKEGRLPQMVVSFLEGYEETEIPEKMVRVIYDTGIEKRGKVIDIG
jgi:hypothetical protein